MARGKKKELTPEERLQEALVPVEEQPYQIPDNWNWLRLNYLCDYMRAGGDKPKELSDVKSDEYNIPVIANGLQDDGIIGYTNIGNESKETVTVSGRGTIGHAVFRDYSYYPVVRLIVLKPNIKYINGKYLKYIFDALEEKGSGTSIPQLTVPMIKDKKIPLPPLAEQQRIVDRIESLFTKLDEAKEKAQEALESFESRKASILENAFSGHLTHEWRMRHPDLSSDVYLQKLKETGSGISRKDFDFWKSNDLPDSWCESKIGNLLYYAGRIGWKGLKASEYTEDGPLFLSVYNLNDGDEVTYHKVYHISQERYEESPEIMVRIGDVLLTKDGAGIGKLGYVKKLPREATINSSLLLIRPGDAAISKFIYYLLLSPRLQNIVKERITGSATPHLFQRDIKEFTLPVPPIEEQEEMIRILDIFFEKEAEAKAQIEATLESIDLMKKSILAKAFRGELGTNDPTEESALELLKSVL